MDFQPLHHADRLERINPLGDVGVATLWTPPAVVRSRLEQAGVDCFPETSRIAVLGTLYGNGLPELLRNLLYNPQISTLVIHGKDLSGSRRELTQFFAAGLEETIFLGVPMFRIVGTTRTLDGGVTPTMFGGGLRLIDLDEDPRSKTPEGLRFFFAQLPPPPPVQAPRLAIPLAPIPETAWFPSEPRDHGVLRDSPLEAWKELLFRLLRFGRPVALKKGARVELLNVHITLPHPREDAPEALEANGFSVARLRGYQEEILRAELPPEQFYTYGHRMRGHFRTPDGGVLDGLSAISERLREDPESRHGYLALWDTGRDLAPGSQGHPCLVSLYFRRFEERLDLTATFRTHNALDGWLRNVYGLMAIQRLVAGGAGMVPGAVSTFSHSMTLDPQGLGLERAKAVAASRRPDGVDHPETGRRTFRPDPRGHFVLTIDPEAGELAAQLMHDGQPLTTYRGRSAEEVEKQLVRDEAVSDIAHALYLGRELARQEALLKKRRAEGGGGSPVPSP
ncbi:MAG: DUF4346 domain-containing protein [Magnetococcales bacterium]|nr:DUF4346 domain-containing protein [Magnetococcales bacterium]